MPIVIGLGSGRCGSHSLASLLNAQDKSVCFHEINPSCMTWQDSVQTAISTVNEFQSILDGNSRQVTIDYSVPNRAAPLERMMSIESIELIGDVASYYLSYVPRLAALPASIRFPCLKRDKNSTVQSFMEKVRIRRSRRKFLADYLGARIMGTSLHTHRNHWLAHDGVAWQRDRIWDKCHPKLSAGSLQSAIEAYYDHYYSIADEFSVKYPKVFQIFPTSYLNSKEGQEKILKFCGIPGVPHISPVHSNRGRHS